MRLLIRLDADHRTGLGHLVRTACLVRRLSSPHDITVVGSGAAIEGCFPGARWLDAGEEPDSLETMIDSLRPDAVLVDLPNTSPVMWRNAATRGVPLIAVDDAGGEVMADVVVNGTVLDEYHTYPSLATDAIVCTGPEYCMIRPQFAEHPWKDAPGRDLVMVVGSAQRAHDWAFCLAGSSELRACCEHATLVVGGAFPDRDALIALARRRDMTVRHSLDADELADLLANSRAALVTGGMIVYECLAVGVPTVVFPQMDNMRAEAQWLARRGLIRDLGFSGGFRLDEVADIVDRLLSERQAGRELSCRARALIDGKGMERAAGVIDRFLRELQT